MDKGKAVLRAVIAQVNLMFAALPPKQSYAIASECVCLLVLAIWWYLHSLSLSTSLCVNGNRKAALCVQFPMRIILLLWSLCVIIGNNAKMEILFTFRLTSINQKIAFDLRANVWLAQSSPWPFRNRKCVQTQEHELFFFSACFQSTAFIQRWKCVGKFRNLACDDFCACRRGIAVAHMNIANGHPTNSDGRWL